MPIICGSWRRQQAVSRARRIRGFRKGAPKLGCYTCGYDCYELTADRCPECNAPIERNPPWWRDGRHSLTKLAPFAVLIPVVSIAGVLWFRAMARTIATSQNPGAWLTTYNAISRFPVYFGLPILLYFATVRTRTNRNRAYRAWVMLIPMVLWAVVGAIIQW